MDDRGESARPRSVSRGRHRNRRPRVRDRRGSEQRYPGRSRGLQHVQPEPGRPPRVSPWPFGPPPRQAPTAVSTPSVVHLRRSIVLTEVDTLAPGDPSWTRVADLPDAAFGLAAAAGPTAGSMPSAAPRSRSGQEVDAFDVATGTWTTVATCRIPGRFSRRSPVPTAASMPSEVKATTGINQRGRRVRPPNGHLDGVPTFPRREFPRRGGRAPTVASTSWEGISDTAGGPRELDIYDPGGNAWTQGATLPGPLYDLAAALGTDGRIYAFGGANGVSSLSPTSSPTMRSAPPRRGDASVNVTTAFPPYGVRLTLAISKRSPVHWPPFSTSPPGPTRANSRRRCSGETAPRRLEGSIVAGGRSSVLPAIPMLNPARTRSISRSTGRAASWPTLSRVPMSPLHR